MTLPRTSIERLVDRIHGNVEPRQGKDWFDLTAMHGQASRIVNIEHRGEKQ